MRLFREAALRQMSNFAGSSALNVLLLGKGGSGKSSLGNALLRRQEFEVSEGMMCSAAGGFRSGQDRYPETEPCLTVVDSPDLTSDLEGPHCELVKAVRGSLEAAFKQCPSDEGFHLVALTVRLDMRFTEEQRQSLNCIADALGDCSLGRVGIVVFTHGDCVSNNEAKFQAFVENIRSDKGDTSGVSSLIDRCGGRFCMVDGSRRCDRGVQQSQVHKLLKLVNTSMVKPLKWTEVVAPDVAISVTPVGSNGSRFLRIGVIITVAACVLGVSYRCWLGKWIPDFVCWFLWG